MRQFFWSLYTFFHVIWCYILTNFVLGVAQDTIEIEQEYGITRMLTITSEIIAYLIIFMFPSILIIIFGILSWIKNRNKETKKKIAKKMVFIPLIIFLALNSLKILLSFFS